MPSNTSSIPFLEINDPFPSPETAMKSDSGLNGLLAAGGDLSVDRLLEAYGQGIFPWFNKNQPVLWWSPDPRMVLSVDSFKLHRSLRKSIASFLARPDHVIKFDSAFDQVIRHCAHAKRAPKRQRPHGQPPTAPGSPRLVKIRMDHILIIVNSVFGSRAREDHAPCAIRIRIARISPSIAMRRE